MCFVGDPDVPTVDLGGDTLTYAWVARDPSGVVIDSGSAPAPGARYMGVGTCRYSYLEAYALNDLSPGTTYAIEVRATITPPAGDIRTITDDLVVTTTGGCPIDAPEESPPAYTYLHALVDDENVVTAVYSIAPAMILISPFSEWGRWAPTYYGWPGKQYAGPGYIYDPAAENFGPRLPAGGELPEADVAGLAGIAACASEPGIAVDLTIAGESQDNCRVEDDAVIGTSAGGCAITVTVRRTGRRATRASSRSFGAFAYVRGRGTRPARPARPAPPLTPARNTRPDGAPLSAQRGTASGVTWTMRSGRVAMARFPAALGTRYRVAARNPQGTTHRGTCVVRRGTAVCMVRLRNAGAWRVAITPIVDGRPGTPTRTRIIVPG